MQLAAKNGRYQPHRNVKIRQMSPIWFIIRRTDKIIRNIIRLATNTEFRRREQHKALSDSIAFENAPIQRLLNGQIVAPRRGANSHCKGLHWIQRMLARIRHLLARVHRRGVYDVKRYSYRSIYSNKGMM